MKITDKQHAGLYIKSLIKKDFDISISEIAERMNANRSTISSLFNGKRSLSAHMALLFETAFGYDPWKLMAVQGEFDVWTASAGGKKHGAKATKKSTKNIS